MHKKFFSTIFEFHVDNNFSEFNKNIIELKWQGVRKYKGWWKNKKVNGKERSSNKQMEDYLEAINNQCLSK